MPVIQTADGPVTMTVAEFIEYQRLSRTSVAPETRPAQEPPKVEVVSIDPSTKLSLSLARRQALTDKGYINATLVQSAITMLFESLSYSDKVLNPKMFDLNSLAGRHEWLLDQSNSTVECLNSATSAAMHLRRTSPGSWTRGAGAALIAIYTCYGRVALDSAVARSRRNKQIQALISESTSECSGDMSGRERLHIAPKDRASLFEQYFLLLSSDEWDKK